MPQVPQIKITDVFLVDVGIARRQLAQRLNELRKAEHMVISDKNIMGGTPVFRGTRVPVHAIAEMIHAGASIREIIEGYPSLNTENVNLALVYAKAHPRRGRPRAQRWSKYIRVKRIRKRLRRAA